MRKVFSLKKEDAEGRENVPFQKAIARGKTKKKHVEHERKMKSSSCEREIERERTKVEPVAKRKPNQW